MQYAHTKGNSGMSNPKGCVECGAAVASYQRITHLERKDKTKEERVRLFRNETLGRLTHGGTNGRKRVV